MFAKRGRPSGVVALGLAEAKTVETNAASIPMSDASLNSSRECALIVLSAKRWADWRADFARRAGQCTPSASR